jgi:RNA polymerase sigma-70 factor, ECF subfamily
MRENLTPSQIEKCVLKAQNGDEKSFAILFDSFYDKIFRYVHFRVSEEDSEDLVSDVFLKVVEKLHTYKSNPKAGFNAWIFRIAHNRVIDFYRQKKELLGQSDDAGNDFFLQIPDDNLRPDQQTNLNLDVKKLQKIMKKLPDVQREILEFKYLEGFSNAEVAKITGKAEGNIRVIQLRALREIRKQW